MQIKRDYSQPFFSNRRRSRVTGRFLFFYGLLIGGFLVFVTSQFGRLQLMALDVVGLAPTATPFASTWAQQGYDLFLRGKMDEAAAAYTNAVSQQPDNVDYLYEYGRTLIELDRAANPAQNRPKADAQMASELGDHALAVAPQDVRSYVLKAKSLVWLDDSESAIPVALQGYEINPGYAPLLAVLARAYTDIGRYQQGLTYGEAAVNADPMDVDAHRGYAISLILVGRRDEAINELEDAINISPNLPAPYFELALQYRGAERYEDAIATYEKVLTIQPRSARAMLRLCETYSLVGQDQQAEGYCDDAISIDSNYKEAYRALGMVNFRRRNYEGSIENFQKCQDLQSEEIECYYLQGLAYYYISECDKAWDMLTISLDRIKDLPIKEPVLTTTQSGLRLVTENCTKYNNAALPTLPPPTAVVTPIG